MRELDYFAQVNQTPRQQGFIEKISESRGYKNNDILNSYRSIYIPSGNEMMELLGSTSIARMLFMQNGRSFAPGKLLIPGFSPLGHLVTYVSYDPIARMEAIETGDYDRPYYFYPEETQGFRKSNFLLMPYEQWETAIETRKISIVDGVFDAGAVSSCGLPCAANLGTTLGEGVKKILSVFDTVSIYKDNDSAGTDLYKSLVRSLRNVELNKVPHTVEKDIDGFINKEGKEVFLNSITPSGRVDLTRRSFNRYKRTL